MNHRLLMFHSHLEIRLLWVIQYVLENILLFVFVALPIYCDNQVEAARSQLQLHSSVARVFVVGKFKLQKRFFWRFQSRDLERSSHILLAILVLVEFPWMTKQIIFFIFGFAPTTIQVVVAGTILEYTVHVHVHVTYTYMLPVPTLLLPFRIS